MVISQQHLKLLEARGLEGETLDRYGVESLKGNEIKIPYVMNGEVVNHKYRTIAGNKAFRQDTGAVKCFWNVDCLKDESLADYPLIITEGEFDAMIALQCGYPRVVSVPDGAPAEEIGDKESVKYLYLDNAFGLKNIKEIILAVDNDEAGVNLLNDLSLRLRRPRCKFLRYPDGCKDLNDVFLKFGKEGIDDVISKAEWRKVEGVYKMDELPPVPEKKIHVIGMLDLHKHYNVRRGDLCVLTGIPSHGKTSFMNEVACRMTMNHNWNISFASFEQHPQSDHRRNLRSFYNSKLVKNQTPEEIKEADEWIAKHFTFIVPNEDEEIDVDWVLERAATAVTRHNASMIVIDPWNEIDHKLDGSQSLTQYTGNAIKQLKKFAKKYDVHLVVVAHPSKPIKEPGGKVRVPSLYDISDSAHWYNKSDVGIIIHKMKDSTLIRIAKSKYWTEIGRPDDVFATFSIETQTYTQHIDGEK